jgi:hypothetical protein
MFGHDLTRLGAMRLQVKPQPLASPHTTTFRDWTNSGKNLGASSALVEVQILVGGYANDSAVYSSSHGQGSPAQARIQRRTSVTLAQPAAKIANW